MSKKKPWAKQKEYDAKRYAEKGDVIRAKRVENYYKNIEKEKAYAIEYKNSGRLRDAKLKRKYGLSADEVDAMIISQNHLCGICKKMMDMPNVDHNHLTGEIRELLCAQCNLSLGLLKEDIVTLTNMIEYIRKYNK